MKTRALHVQPWTVVLCVSAHQKGAFHECVPRQIILFLELESGKKKACLWVTFTVPKCVYIVICYLQWSESYIRQKSLLLRSGCASWQHRRCGLRYIHSCVKQFPFLSFFFFLWKTQRPSLLYLSYMNQRKNNTQWRNMKRRQRRSWRV